MDADTECTLTTMIYSGLLDLSSWQAFLDKAAFSIGGARMQIHGWTDAAGSKFAATTGYDPVMIAVYHQNLARHNPWSRTIIEAPVGRVLASQQLCDEKQLKKTMFYDEWIRPQENISVGAGVVIGRTSLGSFMFGGNIPERDRDTKQPALINLISRLGPHLMLAWRIGHSMSAPRLQSLASGGGLDAAGAALFFFRLDRTIALVDNVGEKILAEGNLIKVDRRGRLSFRNSEAERALTVALREVVKGNKPVVVRVPSNGAWPDISFVGTNYEQVSDWPLAHLYNLPQRGILGIIHRSRNRVTSCLGGFGLTRAEYDVAEEVVQGKTADSIAAQRNVSVATVRTQIRAIYSKCGVNNRAAFAILACKGVRLN